MEGSDEKMSWVILAEWPSVPGDAVARAARSGRLSDLLIYPVYLVYPVKNSSL
jgi:hypothetical protein